MCAVLTLHLIRADSLGVGLLALLYFAVTSYLPEKLHLLADRIHWYITGTATDTNF